jgi:hypothetical protein
MLYSVTVAAVYESCELEKVRNIFYMLTHQIPPGCSLLGRTRPSRAARLAASGRMLLAGTEAPHTHMHTRHRRPACLLHEQKRARTSALHLHGRRACASPCCSSAGRLTPSHGPLDGRLAPTLAPTARRAVAAAPDSPPRERPHGCRRCRRCYRCRRAARLCAYHGRCRRPTTCENRTETPTATPPGSRMAERRPRAPSGAAREAGWRRAKVGGWWRSRADAVEDGPGHFSKP